LKQIGDGNIECLKLEKFNTGEGDLERGEKKGGGKDNDNGSG
jgi:hypothetical protein